MKNKYILSRKKIVLSRTQQLSLKEVMAIFYNSIKNCRPISIMVKVFATGVQAKVKSYQKLKNGTLYVLA